MVKSIHWYEHRAQKQNKTKQKQKTQAHKNKIAKFDFDFFYFYFSRYWIMQVLEKAKGNLRVRKKQPIVFQKICYLYKTATLIFINKTVCLVLSI